LLAQYLNHHSEHVHFKKAETIPHHRDLGMLGVVIHVACDALNNIGVIIAAIVVKYTDSKGKTYADPAVSLFISLMIVASAYPLIKKSGAILLQSSPDGLDVKAIRADLEAVRNTPSSGHATEN
jgi:zinc transporter 1